MAQYVRYIGTSHFREISAKDWDGVGVQHKGLRWDATNAYSVPLSAISDEAWPYIDADPELVLVGEKEQEK